MNWKSSGDPSFQPPWWLSGEQTCEHCLELYSREIGYHCTRCDQPVCPLCALVIRETREIVCPHCTDLLVEE